MRFPSRRLVPFFAAGALLLSACSEDISSREVMLATLQDQGALSPDQAECVTAAMFEGGTYTPDQLKQVATGFTNDDGTEKIPGFEAFANETIKGCL